MVFECECGRAYYCPKIASDLKIACKCGIILSEVVE